jgi:PTH1 family peptidyl-tRNA hydrolase
MHLIAGLGNPGAEHRWNRHNVGFMAAEQIARRHGFPAFRKKFNGLITEGQLDGEKVLILLPQTFMNRSGDSIGAAAKFYKLTPTDITVIYDELDLAPGKVRVKRGGGTGGHNGLRSIDPVIGPDYRRVRIGIGHPGHKYFVHGHVLSDFAKADRDWLEPLMDAIADNAGMLVADDESGFMNKVALGVQHATPVAQETARAKPKGQSHVRQARATKPQAEVPKTGPMAGMLKKLFGGNGNGGKS